MNLLNNYYFPGGNTTKGFFNYYDEILKNSLVKKIYTIKGGPGVGKSTLMKETGKIFEEKNYHINYYHCSSDPDSLDGIFILEKGILLVDGTSPHIIDPVYPGAVYEIINLAEFFDSNNLEKDKEKIINLTDNISSTFKKAYRYLKAIIPLYEDLEETYKSSLNKNEFYSLIRYLIDNVTDGEKGKGFKETKLFLSAITPLGFKNFLDRTLKCKKIYILNSDIGDLTYKVLEKIKINLEIKEFNIECFYCPIGPSYKLEHIIIPEIDTAIVTSNKYHPCYKGEIVDLFKLYDSKMIDQESVNYNLNLIDELLNHSVSVLKEAKSKHDLLEKYYIKAMDYKKLNDFSNQFLNSITD